MLQPYHERAPSYRAQQYRPGIPLDPALRCDLCDGMPVVRGRIAQPGEWLVLDSEGCVTVWSDHDARARFAIPEPARSETSSAHAIWPAGVGVGLPAAPPEPDSVFTAEEEAAIERIVELKLLRMGGG